jgi:hypothetical protein
MRRWGKRRSARPIRDAERARRGGSVAGVECKSGFRQTWEWLGERLRECACLVGVTSLRHYLITNFDGLHGRIRCFKRNLKEATTARAQRCGEVATLVAVLIHKYRLG